ncbi:hypothetical protein PLICRDRAFT_92036 [Plicaturopsis crispa FD-325 SS-3]|nr:hypothetical protein PLICRDRAFT_92036 [Plicaturopsis crispa FD-325 SS-3]
MATTSFAAFASQYLARPGANAQGSSSNPDSTDLDDLEDPHLRASGARYSDDGEDNDDPYLRLDQDEDRLPGASRYGGQSVPLISSEGPDSPRAGWLAHQASPLRSPSPSSSSLQSDPSEHLRPARGHHPPPPPTSREPVSLSLTESLLPRDGTTRPIDVFSLPDPRHTPRSRRKFNDPHWTTAYLALLSVCLLSAFLVLFLTHKPSKSPSSSLPYTTLLHTVPLLTILTFTSAFVAYAHVWLLRVFVKPVMIGTSVFIPATLFISSVWAFVGSFMWDVGKEPTWGETVGLRLFSIVPLVLSLITARRLVHLPRQIHTTSSLLNITTNLLLANPFVLLLSPALLLATLLLSIPFVTLIFRLLLIGYFSGGPKEGVEWHVAGWAGWAIAGTAAVWLWSWGVARGILRVTCAAVIGAWYFADQDLAPPKPTSTHTIHAALTRATSPSLGTIILSALLLTLLRILMLVVSLLRLAPAYLPPYLRPLSTALGMVAAYGENVGSALSAYALVYVGLTGDEFFFSARRVRALVANVDAETRGGYKRRFKTEPPLTLLTIAPLTLAFPFALLTYLFVAHTLGAPASALGAAVLAAAVTSLVGVFCVGVLRDTADTLYVCYCIDKDVGERRRVEVFEAFEYDPRPRGQAQRGPPPPASATTPTQPQYQQQHRPPLDPRASGGYNDNDYSSPSQSSPLSLPTSPPPPLLRSVYSPGPERVHEHEPEADLDPFMEDEDEATLGASAKRDEDEDDEDDQLFPGSDLF